MEPVGGQETLNEAPRAASSRQKRFPPGRRCGRLVAELDPAATSTAADELDLTSIWNNSEAGAVAVHSPSASRTTDDVTTFPDTIPGMGTERSTATSRAGKQRSGSFAVDECDDTGISSGTSTVTEAAVEVLRPSSSSSTAATTAATANATTTKSSSTVADPDAAVVQELPVSVLSSDVGRAVSLEHPCAAGLALRLTQGPQKRNDRTTEIPPCRPTIFFDSNTSTSTLYTGNGLFPLFLDVSASCEVGNALLRHCKDHPPRVRMYGFDASQLGSRNVAPQLCGHSHFDVLCYDNVAEGVMVIKLSLQKAIGYQRLFFLEVDLMPNDDSHTVITLRSQLLRIATKPTKVLLRDVPPTWTDKRLRDTFSELLATRQPTTRLSAANSFVGSDRRVEDVPIVDEGDGYGLPTPGTRTLGLSFNTSSRCIQFYSRYSLKFPELGIRVDLVPKKPAPSKRNSEKPAGRRATRSTRSASGTSDSLFQRMDLHKHRAPPSRFTARRSAGPGASGKTNSHRSTTVARARKRDHIRDPAEPMSDSDAESVCRMKRRRPPSCRPVSNLEGTRPPSLPFIVLDPHLLRQASKRDGKRQTPPPMDSDSDDFDEESFIEQLIPDIAADVELPITEGDRWASAGAVTPELAIHTPNAVCNGTELSSTSTLEAMLAETFIRRPGVDVVITPIWRNSSAETDEKSPPHSLDPNEAALNLWDDCLQIVCE